MDRLIYTALSGMQASMHQQRVLASNMANADTIGFRAELADQRPVTIAGEAMEARAMQQGLVRGARMDAGEMVETGRPLDIAVTANAMIAVQAADGEEAYTRRGDLGILPSGVLVTGEGHPVMGDNGPITIPPGGAVTIAPDGMVSVADPANPAQPPLDIARIKLASWQGSDVAKGLDGLFRVRGGGALPADLDARVQSGSLEQSNVKMTEVLVEMIDQQRLFAMRAKIVGQVRELDESGSQLMRLG